MIVFVLRKKKNYADAIALLQNMIAYLDQLHPKALQSKERQDRVRKIHENFALLYNDSATELFEQKEFDEALKIFKEALRFKPNDHGILSNIGDCYLVGSTHGRSCLCSTRPLSLTTSRTS